MSETQETAPTPGPWAKATNPLGGEAEIWGDVKTGVGTFVCWFNGDDQQTGHANAAHIVKCVNAYPDLVAALKAAPFNPWAGAEAQIDAHNKWWDEVARPALCRAGVTCLTCDGRGEVGGMVRCGDGDVDMVAEPCPDCSDALKAGA